jgi:hypothetical protein
MLSSPSSTPSKIPPPPSSKIPPSPSSKLPPPPSLRAAAPAPKVEDISADVEDAEDSALDASKAPFAEVEEELATSPGASQKPIEAKEYVEDEGATIVRSSPLQGPPLTARPSSTPPPRTQSSPSFGKLPPLPTPPPTSSPIPSAPRSIRVAPAAALVASVPTASSPHYSPPSAPPAPYVAPPTSKQEVTQVRRFGANSSIPPMVAMSQPTPAVVPEAIPEPKKKSGGGLLLMAVLGIAAAAAAGIVGVKYGQQLGLGSGGTGKVVVTAAGANNAPLNQLRVLVDGTARCEASPCTIPELSTGTHFITVEAPGFVTTAARAISVERGGDTALHFDLEASGQKVAAAKEPEPEPAKADAPPPAVPDAKEPSAAAKAAPASKGSVGVGSTKTAEKKPDDKAPKSAATGEGTLNINSIPVANVVLDGRPIGSTPLVGLKVAAGPHSVIFVHPEKGRKAAGATVTAGKTSTVAVRF